MNNYFKYIDGDWERIKASDVPSKYFSELAFDMMKAIPSLDLNVSEISCIAYGTSSRTMHRKKWDLLDIAFDSHKTQESLAYSYICVMYECWKINDFSDAYHHAELYYDFLGSNKFEKILEGLGFVYSLTPYIFTPAPKLKG